MVFITIIIIAIILFAVYIFNNVIEIRIERHDTSDESTAHIKEDNFCVGLINKLPALNESDIIHEFRTERYQVKGINIYVSADGYKEGFHDGHVVASDVNEYDMYAISVYDEDNSHIGYLPKGNGELHSLIKLAGGAMRCEIEFWKGHSNTEGNDFGVAYLNIIKDLYAPIRIEKITPEMAERLGTIKNLGPDVPVTFEAVMRMSPKGGSVRLDINGEEVATVTTKIDRLKSHVSQNGPLNCKALFFCPNRFAKNPTYNSYVIINKN